MIEMKTIHSTYKNQIFEFEVDYSFINAGIQKTTCVSENVLKELIFTRTKIGRLNEEQRKYLKNVINYFKINMEINSRKQYINKLSDELLNEHNDIVKNFIKNNENTYNKYQLCTKCHKYFPYDNFYFVKNKHSSKGLNTVCRECSGGANFINIIKKYNKEQLKNNIINNLNTDKKYIDLKTSEEIMNYYTRYKVVINPSKEIYKNLLLKVKNEINLNLITYTYFKDEFNFDTLKEYFSINEIHFILFGENVKENVWKYPKYKIIKEDMNFELCKKIFNNYLIEQKIIINAENLFSFNYSKTFERCKIYRYIVHQYLEFIMYLYDYKFPAYKFKVANPRYWDIKINRVEALKYFIEKDKKISKMKIPLYLTKMNLQRNARTLYNILYCKKYYKNLFEWVNEVYPNVFEQSDFEITKYRDDFDSHDELVIDNILRENNKNTIYNSRKTRDAICIDGMYPDWIVPTAKGCYLIEYFGLYVNNNNKNEIIQDYKTRTNNKLIKYKKLNNKYNFIALYPEDMNNKCEGIINKIQEINDLRE